MQAEHEPRTSLTREELRVAVAEGIAAAMTEEVAERFWAIGLQLLQRQAQKRAGEFLLTGIATALKKALWIGLVVGAVYSLGGWTIAKAVWTAMVKTGS